MPQRIHRGNPRDLAQVFEFRGLAQLHDRVVGNVATQRGAGVDQHVAPQNRARVQDRVATRARAVAQDRAELDQAGVDHGAVGDQANCLVGGDLVVRKFGAGAEVRVVAEHRVAAVVVVRCGGAVEQHRVLEFGRVADHAVVADKRVAVRYFRKGPTSSSASLRQ